MDRFETVKNISYSFVANLVSLFVSIFMVMFVPKFLSLDDYGLWQLFLFYFSYLGFLHFGWEDGIYLRYAGKDFTQLDKKLFAGQFYGIIFLQIFLAFFVSMAAKFLVEDTFKQTALMSAIWLAPLVNFNNLCNFIMQITNRIKDYAKLILAERLMLCVGVLVVLISGLSQFFYMYGVKLLSIGCVAVIGAWLCRSLLCPQFYSWRENLDEAGQNIWIGIKLMFANIADMLLVGIIRYGISLGWDVATFGRVSLTLGVSNFLMVFIGSLSVVIFPIVQRMDGEHRVEVYQNMREGITIVLLGILLMYYPARCLLGWWLPQYADSLVYMSVLFPVCLFESKVSLLINTYLKSMRQEVLMLKLNVTSVVVSVLMTVISVEVLHNLDIAVLSIPMVYAFRCILAECYMEKLINLHLKKVIAVDVLMASIFMFSGWFIDSWYCILIYGSAYIVYLLFHWHAVKALVAMVIRTD